MKRWHTYTKRVADWGQNSVKKSQLWKVERSDKKVDGSWYKKGDIHNNEWQTDLKQSQKKITIGKSEKPDKKVDINYSKRRP